MKQQTKTLLVWLGLIVAVLALANLFNTSQQVKSISYAKFVEQIDNEWNTFDDTTLARDGGWNVTHWQAAIR